MRTSSNAQFRKVKAFPGVSVIPSRRCLSTVVARSKQRNSSSDVVPRPPRDDVAYEVEGTPRMAKGKSIRSNMKVMGLDLNPELVAISMVYFVQGILGLSRLATSFFFKDELHIEPAEAAVIGVMAGIPWMIKPLYGFLSDSVPLFGYRRRSYLVASGLLGTAAWAALATVVHSPLSATVMMVGASLSTAMSDVVVDSIVVERARGAPQATSGSLQSLCWGSSAVGGIASAYFSGSLVETYGCRFVFAITALFPLVVSAAALLIDEAHVSSSSNGSSGSGSKKEVEMSEEMMPLKMREGDSSDGMTDDAPQTLSGPPQPPAGLRQQLRDRVHALWSAVRRKDILLPTVFVFLWQATPTADTAMFYFQTNALHFTPEFLGRVRLVASIASLLGVVLYNSALKAVPLRRMLWWCMLLGVLLGSSQLLLISGANRSMGIDDQMFVLGDSVILTTLGQVSFMPILVLAARLCPEGVEATLFATLMSILNGGSFAGSGLGGALTSAFGVTSTDFTHLFALYAVCNFASLLPAPFLFLLPEELSEEHKEGGSGGAGGGGDDKLV